MTRRGCGMGCAVALGLLFAAGLWFSFASAHERERAVSPDGKWVAIAYVQGTALTAANERVHVWRWWQPRFRWLGCQVLEAKDESPTRLLWRRTGDLLVQHGFRPHELVEVQRRCGSVQVSVEKKFAPYS